ncbi:hypothetical protein ACJX0J_040895, partial [Zea mays]
HLHFIWKEFGFAYLVPLYSCASLSSIISILSFFLTSIIMLYRFFAMHFYTLAQLVLMNYFD